MRTNNLETQVPNLTGDGYTILETTWFYWFRRKDTGSLVPISRH